MLTKMLIFRVTDKNASSCDLISMILLMKQNKKAHETISTLYKLLRWKILTKFIIYIGRSRLNTK